MIDKSVDFLILSGKANKSLIPIKAGKRGDRGQRTVVLPGKKVHIQTPVLSDPICPKKGPFSAIIRLKMRLGICNDRGSFSMKSFQFLPQLFCYWFYFTIVYYFLTNQRPSNIINSLSGGVAHLGERLNGIQEVRGSIPLISTGKCPF